MPTEAPSRRPTTSFWKRRGSPREDGIPPIVGLRPFFWAAAYVVATTFSFSPTLSFRSHSVQTGSIATRDVVAPRDLIVPDPVATERRRSEAIAGGLGRHPPPSRHRAAAPIGPRRLRAADPRRGAGGFRPAVLPPHGRGPAGDGRRRALPGRHCGQPGPDDGERNARTATSGFQLRARGAEPRAGRGRGVRVGGQERPGSEALRRPSVRRRLDGSGRVSGGGAAPEP